MRDGQARLRPPNLKGVDLFEHMAAFARRTSKGPKLSVSNYLDVEVSVDQEKILNPSAQELTMRDLMKDAGGDGATMKMAKRRLDSLGVSIKAHSCIANDPKRIKRLESAAQLAASLAEVARIAKDDKAAKKVEATNELHDAAPAALMKLRTKLNDVKKLTKKEICAIGLRYFGSTLNESNPKPQLISSLEALIAARPLALEAVIFDDESDDDADPAPAAPVAPAACAARAPPADSQHDAT